MYQSKFIEIFEKLTKQERIGFRKWVLSPFANPREDVQRLTEFVLSKRAITPTSMRRKEAFTFVFPNQEYNEPLLRYAMSYTTQCLEEFLAYHNWKQNPLNPAIMLTQVYNHRNLNVLTAVQLETTQALLQDSPLQDSRHYIQTLETEIEYYNLLSKNKRYENFNLQKIADTIHHYAAAEILRYTCVAQSFKQVSGTQTNFLLLESILQLIANGHYKKQPAIQIYYLLYLLSNQPDDVNFRKLYDLVFTHETAFKENELKDIFLLSINYCIKQLNTGKQEYAKDAFTLYLHALEKKYLLENGELSRFTFKNIAFIGIKRLGAYKETELFIKQYNQYINQDFRENAILFTKAALYYAQKQYAESILILQQTEFKDVLWNADAKILMIKMLFEQKEFETISFHLKSLKMYLYRQKNIGYFKSIYQKTISFFEIMYKNIGSGKTQKNSLKKLIAAEKDLIDKEWFSEILDKI